MHHNSSDETPPQLPPAFMAGRTGGQRENVTSRLIPEGRWRHWWIKVEFIERFISFGLKPSPYEDRRSPN